MQLTECLLYNSALYFAKDEVAGIKDISIYMGGKCNFNCSYCDREYIKGKGFQKLEADNLLQSFLKKLMLSFEAHQLKLPIVSFHGGETLLYLQNIKKIIRSIKASGLQEKAIFYIQTNGSLILKNKEFFEEFASDLYVSISYDFSFQRENRTEYDIEETLSFLDKLNIKKQLQYVIPTNHSNPFGLDALYAILNLYSKHKIHSLNLILLRHVREVNEFKTIIADKSIDLHKVFSKFIQFFQLLYVAGINVAIDGHTIEIEKDYYENHKQIVLAPDGFIYPEYQFIEYKAQNYNIGAWSQFHIERRQKEKIDSLVRPECLNCDQRTNCGLQYYYSMFNIPPADSLKCRTFYSLIDLSIRHLAKLKKHKSLLEAVGI